MRLLPREVKFFTYFNRQAELIHEASILLLEGVQAGNAHLAEVAAKINELEGKADEIIHEVFTRLGQTFITPLDPEDIHSLASHLDDVMDGIEEAAHRIVAYRLEPVPAEVIEFCQIVHDAAVELEKAFVALEKNDPVLPHCIEVNRLEGAADRLGRKVVPALFQHEKDPIALLKLKEVYEILEDTTDRCEDVADALQNVVVKNG